MATTYPPAAPVHHPHPVHAILSAYPLAFFTAALVADIAYVNSAEMMWANFSIWLITGGLLMGAFAALAGIIDAIAFKRRQTRHRGAMLHTIGTSLMLVLALFNAFVHSRDAWTSVVPTGIVLSAIVAILALYTSWQGYAVQAEGTVPVERPVEVFGEAK
ncbi:DUF2231 domain-containing protein [Sphingomonas endolithica]|uniref:DUF2231 domain-containing protein n=1 Tax=Sphingomonas endolithica TaxID=2972485 RepID=UPI0021B01BF8|nr:DUF2231 domain-containing protein [Sphingomonas sp. ZFBP2030]